MNLNSTLMTTFIAIFSILTVPSFFSLSHQPTAVSARSLPELHTTEALTVQTTSYTPVKCKAPHNPPGYKKLCNKTPSVTLCLSVVKADKRKKLKSTPEGLVVIMVDAAKRNVITTTNFINTHLKNTTDPDTVMGLKNCLVGYRTITPHQLDITVKQLRCDPVRRKEFSDLLRDTADEVDYDCRWFQPEPYPELLKLMVARQNIFDRLLHEIARNMIDLIK